MPPFFKPTFELYSQPAFKNAFGYVSSSATRRLTLLKHTRPVIIRRVMGVVCANSATPRICRMGGIYVPAFGVRPAV